MFHNTEIIRLSTQTPLKSTTNSGDCGWKTVPVTLVAPVDDLIQILMSNKSKLHSKR
jgi:hypothetical protein